MKHNIFSNKLFIGGLIIGGLILTLGVFLILNAIITPNFNKSKFREDTAVISTKGNKAIYNPLKNKTATKTEKNSTKPDAAGTYFEGTAIPKLTEQELWVAMMTWHKGPQTVQALMESYHVAYLQLKMHREIDKVVPLNSGCKVCLIKDTLSSIMLNMFSIWMPE